MSVMSGDDSNGTSAAPVSALASTARLWNRLAGALPEAQCVARAGARDINESGFRQQVNAWRVAFGPLSAPAIALYEPDGVEFAAALCGAWYAGKTVYLPGDAQVETCRALANLQAVFVGQFPGEFDTIERAAVEPQNETPATSFQPLNADTANLVIFTSGSTGAPQAVPKRFTQLLAEVETLEQQFGRNFAASDVVVATVSHQHIYGLLFKILWPLNAFRVFESESVRYPEQLAAQLAVCKTVVVSGPAHLKRLPDSLDWARVRKNVRAVFSSGGPLPFAAVSHSETLLGTAPIEVYGSSETGGVAWRQRTNGADSPWSTLPHVEVRAEDGRLAVRSSHLSTGDWLVVDDYAEFDAAGRFVLKGRADRIAKIEGKRVSLMGMEKALLGSGLVADVRLVQLESTRDEIGAVVVPSNDGWTELRVNGSSALRQKLNDALRGSVERLAHPRRWRWVDTLPVNAAGKTTHAAVVLLFDEAAVTLPAFHVLSCSASEVAAELYVSPQLPVFDGHFRGIPVLPGVAQLDWVMLYGRKLFGIDTPYVRMEAVKFHRVYQTGPMLSLTMLWNAERRMLAFRYESPNSTHSSGRIFFAA
ncbi:MAG: acyl-CoA synthetase [Phycisphaerae bacterium]|nr:acyl-CoA synthetase [Gemmatimonadaceae bacterium]